MEKTILEWFGCEEGMTIKQIKTRLEEIWDWGTKGLEEEYKGD